MSKFILILNPAVVELILLFENVIFLSEVLNLALKLSFPEFLIFVLTDYSRTRLIGLFDHYYCSCFALLSKSGLHLQLVQLHPMLIEYLKSLEVFLSGLVSLLDCLVKLLLSSNLSSLLVKLSCLIACELHAFP